MKDTNETEVFGPDEWESTFLRQIVDSVGDPIFVKDDRHRWIYLNEAYCQFMGHSLEELLGKSDYDFFPKAEADVFWERDNVVLSTGKPDENEESFTDAEGVEHIIITKKTRFIDEKGRHFLVGVIRDVTERKRLEARLSVAKRLMSLGTLAGGVAHEINNPLSFVLGNLEYIQEAADDLHESTEDFQEALDAAIKGALRVKDVVQGLQTFSHSAGEDFKPVDLRKSLQSTVNLAKNEIRHRAQLVESYGDIPLVEANPRSLGQVFLNLLINATQALPLGEASENTIEIKTSTTTDGNAMVEVIDTGTGIDDEIRHRIFDPFFTTKAIGEGTGLGLSIVHTLVDAMNGHIDVESQPGEGTTFRLIFPPAEATEIEEISVENEISPQPPAEEERPRVLIIDDEPEVFNSLRRRLKRFFRFKFSAHPREALDRLVAHPERFDLVICDVMMPDMNGRNFYEALQKKAPHYLKRLAFISGGVFSKEMRDFLEEQNRPVLDKFVSLHQLQEIIE